MGDVASVAPTPREFAATDEAVDVPRASCPADPLPHAVVVKFEFTSRVWLPPPLRRRGSLTFAAITGVEAFVDVPSPSCPELLSPQHETAPEVRVAQA